MRPKRTGAISTSAAVEVLTGRKSDRVHLRQYVDPDIAAELFILDGPAATS